MLPSAHWQEPYNWVHSPLQGKSLIPFPDILQVITDIWPLGIACAASVWTLPFWSLIWAFASFALQIGATKHCHVAHKWKIKGLLWANSFMLLAMRRLKCLWCIIVFDNVGSASISIKPLPDRYLSHQQAYLQLTNWVNESFAVQNIRTI